MKKIIVPLVVVLLLVIGAGAGLLLLPQKPASAPGSDLALAALLNSTNNDFAEVQPDWLFRFPNDHAAHPDFRTETWYFNASLQTSQSHFFGFQLNFFRLALTPEKPDTDSAWATNQIYRAHVAVSDQQNNQFYADEKFSRVALGLAGSETNPASVWLENWRMQVSDDTDQPTFTIQLASEEMAAQLTLKSLKTTINDSALSDRRQPFHAYWLPRLQVEGSLNLAGETLAVSGTAWFDHLWGLVPMGRGQLALNRFVIQLDDQRELLIFQLRRRDGSGQPLNSGFLIDADGKLRELKRRDIELEAQQDEWYSPKTAVSYPLHWRLRLTKENLTLMLSPLIENQELDLALRYWAGAMQVSGEANGKSITGHGFIELSGYAQ